MAGLGKVKLTNLELGRTENVVVITKGNGQGKQLS